MKLNNWDEISIEKSTSISKDEMELLLLADPSSEVVNGYLKQGDCFVFKKDTITVGIMILIPTRPETIEIINIAVSEKEQGKGYGKYLLGFAIDYAKKEKYKTIEIGTGNSSLMQLGLYQKCGFRITNVDRDFFLRNYEDEIYENGIQCIDMIRLTQYL
ncbi:GNAT family N-acetyltransferase [Bacillus mycoides]|uniref:GNAT family N-acetyltransferase n=1 Tax=Bacillus mycoides TaxID=1405 RepID=A0A4U3AEJ8_BACMY|nr:GNAT family N-acetyltransferase [Bacillus mycoides]TKI86397.1 GNAT family N-acetyltransferase [Bacillus mycoides]